MKELRFSESLVYYFGARDFTAPILKGLPSSDKMTERPKFVEYFMGYRINGGPIQYEKTEELANEWKKINPSTLANLKSDLARRCKAELLNLIHNSDFVFFMTTVKNSSGKTVSAGRAKFYEDILKSDEFIYIIKDRDNTGPDRSAQVTKRMYFVSGYNRNYVLDECTQEQLKELEVGKLTKRISFTDSINVLTGCPNKDIGTIIYSFRTYKARYQYKENILYTLKGLVNRNFSIN